MNGTNMIADVYVNIPVIDNTFAKFEEFNISSCSFADVNILLTTLHDPRHQHDAKVDTLDLHHNGA